MTAHTNGLNHTVCYTICSSDLTHIHRKYWHKTALGTLSELISAEYGQSNKTWIFPYSHRHSHMHTRTRTHTHTHMYTRTHTTYMYTHTYTHISTHTAVEELHGGTEQAVVHVVTLQRDIIYMYIRITLCLTPTNNAWTIS